MTEQPPQPPLKLPPALKPLLVDEPTACLLVGGISTRLLFDLRAKHGLPFVQIGSRVLYRPQDLAKWVEGLETKRIGA